MKHYIILALLSCNLNIFSRSVEQQVCSELDYYGIQLQLEGQIYQFRFDDSVYHVEQNGALVLITDQKKIDELYNKSGLYFLATQTCEKSRTVKKTMVTATIIKDKKDEKDSKKKSVKKVSN